MSARGGDCRGLAACSLETNILSPIPLAKLHVQEVEGKEEEEEPPDYENLQGLN